MNERIQKLMSEANLFCRTDETVTLFGETYAGQAEVQKFAQLIVRECAKFCDEVIKESEIAMEQCKMVKSSDRLMMLHDGTRNGAQMSKNRFKQYFGVSE